MSAFSQLPLNRTTNTKGNAGLSFGYLVKEKNISPDVKSQDWAYRARMISLIPYPVRRYFIGYGIDTTRGEGAIQPVGTQKFSPLVLAIIALDMLHKLL